MHGLRRALTCSAPPIHQGVLTSRYSTGQAQPGKYVVPNLLGERAFQDQVFDRFRRLITEWTVRWVHQAAASKAISCLAAAKVGKPVE